MKIKPHKIIGYLFVLLLILNGGSIVKVLGIGAEFQLGTLIVMFITLILAGKFNYKKTFISILFFVPLFLLISSIQMMRFGNIEAILSNQIFNFVVAIIIGILISIYFYSRKGNFMLMLSNILKIIIIHAIISSLVLTIFPTKNILFNAVVNNESVNSYVGYFYIFFQRMHLSYLDTLGMGTFNLFNLEIFRAHGIFWEPGVFATYVNIFIFLNLFIFINILNVFLGIFSIILSWSSTGILVLTLQLMYYSFTTLKFDIRSILKVFTASLLIIAIGWISVINMDDKIYGDNSGSSAQRFMDTMSAIEIAKNYPMIGIGVDFELFSNKMSKAKPDVGGVIGNQLSLDRVNKNGYSNSLIRIFVYFGIPLGILLLFAFYKQDMIPKNKGLFAIINFICLAASPILFLTFHFTFIINGLMYQLKFLKNNTHMESAKKKKEIGMMSVNIMNP